MFLLRNICYTVCLYLFVILSPAVLATDFGVVTQFDYEPLDLFKSTHREANPVASTVASKQIFPIKILQVSKNGMLKVNLREGEYWVLEDDVITDRKIRLSGSCEPETKGATVAFGVRGLGEQCE